MGTSRRPVLCCGIGCAGMSVTNPTVMDRRNDAFRALLLAPVLIGAGLLGLLVQIPEAALDLPRGGLAAFAATVWLAALAGGVGLILSSFWFFGADRPVNDNALTGCAVLSIGCSAFAFFQAILIVAEWMQQWPGAVGT